MCCRANGKSHKVSLITSLGEERANLSAFVRFVLVWICRFPLLRSVWEGLRFVVVALPGLFSYLFFTLVKIVKNVPTVFRYINSQVVQLLIVFRIVVLVSK